ncbi:MAG: trypsin-like peptidase domain-containing protein [Candidatus Niyogibacteria bacterium]|nr:trypsin-like peptidase domain-containing protein [Candidatus Niyogibacteria bacterium]
MDYEQKIISVTKKALPAVVSIVITKDLEQITSELSFNPMFNNPYDRAFLESKLREAPKDEHGRIKIGGGSGFIISPDGIVLTNKHVVMDTKSEYGVIMGGGKKYDAEVLARDPLNDVAIIKIKAKGLPYLELGSALNLELGQTVIAIGNALNEFQNTVSTGVVSGLSRLITATTDIAGHQERLKGLIQTDAAINPGNSGGPMINLDGKVIGINSAIVFGAQNIGFAIPIERAKADLEEIKKYGRIRRPFIGLRHIMLNQILKDRFHLPVENGALIMSEGLPQGETAVIPNSPAEKAGIKEFDIILRCNNKDINEENTLEDQLSNLKIGDAAKLTVLREGKKLEKKIVLGEINKQTLSADVPQKETD